MRNVVLSVLQCLNHRRQIMIMFSSAVVAAAIVASLYASSRVTNGYAVETMDYLIVKQRKDWTPPRNDFSISNETYPLSDESPSFTDICFKHNSEEWLNGPRYGNINVSISDAYLKIPFLDSIDRLMAETLCLPESKLGNSSIDSLDLNDRKALRRWAVRMAYAAIYHHQHVPALREIRQQQADSRCQHARNVHKLGDYDYECPDAKFLVVALTDAGLGANMVHLATVALMAGVLHDRIVVFANNVPPLVNRPWSMVSCARGDYQCVYAPLSPCVLTMRDLMNSTKLSTSDHRIMVQKGRLPNSYREIKTIYLPPRHFPNKILGGLVPKAIQVMAGRVATQMAIKDPRQQMISRATRTLVDPEDPRDGYDYEFATNKIHHALLYYAMRPNHYFRYQLDQNRKTSLPVDFVPDHAIGFPIRGSDKCRRESECLTFDQNLRLLNETWYSQLQGLANPFVIVTSEDSTVIDNVRLLTRNESLFERYPFRIVMNTRDIPPNSGRFQRFANVSADDGMLMALSTLQLQLAARVTIGNCCSQFHRLMNDFLSEGCGLASTSFFQCLQNAPNPEFRLCCMKSSGCVSKRLRDLEAMQNFSHTKTAA